MYLVVLLFALFASTFAFQKEILTFSAPFFSVGFRMSLAGILLLAWAISTKQTTKIKLAHIKHLTSLTLLNIYITNICEIWGIKYMGAAKTCLMYSLSPFVTALIAFIVLKETLSPKKWLGLAIGFIGALPILFIQTQQEFRSGKILIFSFAEIAMLFGILCNVYGWIILKKILKDYHYSPIFANGISMLFGGILALMHSFFTGEVWAPIPVTHLQPFLINTIIVCLISNIIAYNLYGVLLKRFSATFMSLAGLITPVFASLFAFIFFREIISWHYFTAMLLFTIGLKVFHQEELIHNKLPTNQTTAKP